MKIRDIKLRNNLVLAPMAGVTDLPFRLLAVREGCGLVVSEMVSAKGLIMGGEKSRALLSTLPEESPLAIQLFGSEPDSMAEAALIAEKMGASIIDINMGCPVKKIVGNGAGSALLKDLRAIGNIIGRVRKRINIPLTVKIRSGWDSSNIVAPEVLKVAQENGADAVAIHARTKVQGFGGSADWSIIEKLKNIAEIPVIGNGDVGSAEDVAKMIKVTGCDGVMIGRGAMGNPWIFRQALDLMEKGSYKLPALDTKSKVVLEHLDLVLDMYGDLNGVRLFRKHLAWYTRGMAGSSRFRSKINSAATPDEVRALLDDFFSCPACTPDAGIEIRYPRGEASAFAGLI